MMDSRYLLCSDLDRTLLPNGKEENDNVLPKFFEIIKKHNICLAYVSGRSLKLLKSAISEYEIELPDFFIGDVGTTIYKKVDGELVFYDKWSEKIRTETPGWNFEELREIGKEVERLELQEAENLNEFKVSFYVSVPESIDDLASLLENRIVRDRGITAKIISSIDPIRGVGLIDIVPQGATKQTAIEFVRQESGIDTSKVIFCGDSGNDLLAFLKGYKGILVKNGSYKVRKEIKEKLPEERIKETIYFAEGRDPLNGNYASGILEGMLYWGVISEEEYRNSY